MAKVKELQQYTAQCIAECFGTFMLILIGEAGIAQYKLSKQGNHSTITINLSFAIGVYTGMNDVFFLFFFLCQSIFYIITNRRKIELFERFRTLNMNIFSLVKYSCFYSIIIFK